MNEEPFSLSSFSRINVVGTSGSGKSTFAKKLSSALGYPYVEMDKVFWGPNWKKPSEEEFFDKLRLAVSGPQWVLDGNYTRTIPIKWENIELVIWLDYSFPRALFQAIRRASFRAWTKEELWEGTGNRESFRKSFFSRESIIWWTITTYTKTRKKYESYLSDKRFSHIQFIRLKNHAEAQDFLATLQKDSVPSQTRI